MHTMVTRTGMALVLLLAAGSAPAAAQTAADKDARPAVQEDPDAEWLPREVAVLQGLDKVTARISTVSAPVGGTATFGTLSIEVSTCQERPPTLPPESAAFLRIDDHPPDAPARRLFSGWMFASSPALNALEHPVYDVWMLSCRSASTASQSSAPGSN